MFILVVVLLQELTVFFLQIIMFLLRLWIYYDDSVIEGYFQRCNSTLDVTVNPRI